MHGNKQYILMIMDGVGLNDESKGNAFKLANTPNLDKLIAKYPNTYIATSGMAVGLPEGQMGNSEVGHTNIGAGRIVYQDLTRITKEINDGDFFKNEEFLKAIENVKNNNSSLHLMGLLSDGGVHSHNSHLYALLKLAKEQGIENVYIHAFLDGRDTPPTSAIEYLKELEEKIKEIGVGKIATLAGRYYAMDRDNNYDRVKLAYDAMTVGSEKTYSTAIDAWEENQKNNITDEFIVPATINRDGLIEDNDGIVFANFRPDRVRELASCLTNVENHGFERKTLSNLKMVTLMPVSDEVKSAPMFHLEDLVKTLGEYASTLGLSQLRIAETEKYAHVTYFFDGGVEKELKGASRILIASPKVATYDLKPEMSAYEITDSLLKEIDGNHPDLIILNFANGDMVGHTGNYNAAVMAVETLDKCIEKIISHVDLEEYDVIITADHGNCEVMINDDGSINTQHTTNVVPFIVLSHEVNLRKGKLGDIAVTILDLMGQPIPKEMTGSSLLVK